MDKEDAVDPVRVPDVTALADAELVREVGRRAALEREATAALLRALIEFDHRQLYLGEGFPSLYAYCTGALHYSEHAAFNRIEVARAAARWPQLLSAIEDGSLHLAGARLLAPHLTEENVEAAIASARHRSKRDIEEVAAALAHRNILVAAGAEQYRLHLTISRQTRDLLRQVQALLSHQLPDGNPAVIFEKALSVLLADLEAKRFGKTTRPERPTKRRPRRPSAAVRRAVFRRDGGQCAFVGAQGRCAARDRLEFHHVKPFADGGKSTVDNIQLRCRAHNQYEAELYFGRPPGAMTARGGSSVGCSAETGAGNSPRDELTG